MQSPGTERRSSTFDRRRTALLGLPAHPRAPVGRPRRTEWFETGEGSGRTCLRREWPTQPRRSDPVSTRRAASRRRRTPRTHGNPWRWSPRGGRRPGAPTPERSTARRFPSCSISSSGCGPSSQRFCDRTRAPRRSTRRSTTSPKNVMTHALGTSCGEIVWDGSMNAVRATSCSVSGMWK